MSQTELDTLDNVLTVLRTGQPSVRRRLVRGVAVLLASGDGRYLEALDLHLSQLEASAEELTKT
jgi:hypothetical protein